MASRTRGGGPGEGECGGRQRDSRQYRGAARAVDRCTNAAASAATSTPATPATAATPPAAAAPLAVQGAALQALQNATSDPRLTASLVGPDGAPTASAAGEAVHALRDACALPHPALADVAFGAVANLQQAATDREA